MFLEESVAFWFMMTSSNETFPALLALCAWNSPIIGEFSTQRSVTPSFDISLICPWINVWVKKVRWVIWEAIARIMASLLCWNLTYRLIPMVTRTKLCQVVAWCRACDKPLPEPILIVFDDAYLLHQFIWKALVKCILQVPKLHICYTKFLRFSRIPYHLCGPDDMIQNACRDLVNSRGTLSIE